MSHNKTLLSSISMYIHLTVIYEEEEEKKPNGRTDGLEDDGREGVDPPRQHQGGGT